MMIDPAPVAIAGAALLLTYILMWHGLLTATRQVTKVNMSVRIQGNICRWGGFGLLVVAVALAVVQR